jgi:hypothetical protein
MASSTSKKIKITIKTSFEYLLLPPRSALVEVPSAITHWASTITMTPLLLLPAWLVRGFFAASALYRPDASALSILRALV